MSHTSCFQLVREGGGAILRIALDRPAQRNAMSRAMVDAMLALLDTEGAGDEARVIIVHGLGRGFYAGSDLGELAEMRRMERAAFEADCGTLSCRLNDYPVPVIAAVHGFAIGGGLTLAAACDMVISTADATWSLPEVPIGLFPAWGLGAVDDRIGLARARRLALGMDRLTGTQAADWGLVDEIASEPLAHASALAASIIALPAAQLAQAKAHYRRADRWTVKDQAANARFLNATESAEAQASFLRFGKG
ncbi:enoyl-CoA hydratase/isomerase family protein [Sphingobium sp. JS3065]|uniref:enoyl-CoA hydratase/isomerase family protein n=1 Tax=Sphingobium sp. JS3065 TaxID=2970925 RepID=UPI0022649C30|nr:enoyl-CoA hydratase/isomerase family protein [Sphingobium sp. JS3065]UZW57033.1 enoyl-CoA hydratase/isomerase family protein [Sphingobium sp. JS3065]